MGILNHGSEPNPPLKSWTMPVPAFKAIHFIPRGSENDIRKTPARELYAVAHGLLTPGGGNHWCFYISISDDSSVRIDATPSGTPGSVMPMGQKANVVVSELAELFPQEAQHTCRLGIRPGATIGDFLDAIIQYGREKYDFDHDGRGCRYWTSTQIDLFLQLGLILNQAEADQAKDDILIEFADKKQTGRRYPLTVGQYY